MKTMRVSEFKAKALSTITDVSTTRETVVLTRRGKPLAKLVPYDETSTTSPAGRLARYLIRETDIVTPLGSKDWEAAR